MHPKWNDAKVKRKEGVSRFQQLSGNVFFPLIAAYDNMCSGYVTQNQLSFQSKFVQKVKDPAHGGIIFNQPRDQVEIMPYKERSWPGHFHRLTGVCGDTIVAVIRIDEKKVIIPF